MFVHDDEFSSRTWHLQGEVTIVEFAPPMNDAWHALARRASCVVQIDLRRPATDSPGIAYDGVRVVRLHNISSDEVVVEHTDGDTAGTRHTLGVFGSSDVSAVVSGCAAIMFNCLVRVTRQTIEVGHHGYFSSHHARSACRILRRS